MRRRYRRGVPAIAVPAILAILLAFSSLLLLERGEGIGGAQAGLDQDADADVVRMYSSVPMNEYISVVHGVQMAIEEAGGRAGRYRVEYVPLNGAREEGGKWDAAVEMENARRVVEDPRAVFYIGTYNSGAAKISIPVLNRAGIPMVSPGNTYPGLTKPDTGAANEPWVYYPLGPQSRNYFRVVPADDIQGAAGLDYAAGLGVKQAYVLDDTELYGVGVANVFERRAGEKRVKIAGRDSLYGGADIPALAQKIKATGADCVYFGGIAQNRPAELLQALSRAGWKGVFLGADGIATDTFAEGAAGFGEGIRVYSTSLGLPADKLSGPGAGWYSRYRARYPDDRNENFAPFGYEAGRVALSAISRAGDLGTNTIVDRDKVRRAAMGTGSRDLAGPPILGEWRFDANGDTSLRTISVLELPRGDADIAWTYLGPGPGGE